MNELSFDSNSTLEDVRYDPDSKEWIFRFSDSISILVAGFWRLLVNGKVSLVSMDHGHQFGLSKPVDMRKELVVSLQNSKLKELRVDEDSGDLRLSFTNNIEMEVLITSTGYESYQIDINGKRYIALGGGDIGIY